MHINPPPPFPIILSHFIALDLPQRLLLLQQLAGDDNLRENVQLLMDALPGWGAHGMGTAFEEFDELREMHLQEQKDQQQSLLVSEGYFSAVFGACDDAESVKQVMMMMIIMMMMILKKIMIMIMIIIICMAFLTMNMMMQMPVANQMVLLLQCLIDFRPTEPFEERSAICAGSRPRVRQQHCDV